MQDLCDALQQAAQLPSAAPVAARSRRVNADKINPLLQALVALSLLCQTPESVYVL